MNLKRKIRSNMPNWYERAKYNFDGLLLVAAFGVLYAGERARKFIKGDKSPTPFGPFVGTGVRKY